MNRCLGIREADFPTGCTFDVSNCPISIVQPVRMGSGPQNIDRSRTLSKKKIVHTIIIIIIIAYAAVTKEVERNDRI